MRTPKPTAWAWKWRFLIATNLYLISPVLWYELRPFEGGPDKTILFTLPSSVLWLTAVQLLIRRLWIAHAIMFPLYVLVAIDLYLISTYRMRLSSSTLLVILENLEDALGYIRTNWERVGGSFVAMIAGYGVCLWKIRELRVPLPRALALGPALGLAFLYFGVYRLSYNWMFVCAADRNSPFGFFSQCLTAREIYSDSQKHAERAKSFVFGATRRSNPPESEVYVLVIGESSRPHNWGLYGYWRDTNPRLSKVTNLVVFQDVVSQSALTRVSVPLLITRGTITDPSPAERERSIVSAYREVGFLTHWISTQQRDPYTGAINRFPREADVQLFFERRHDGETVEALRRILARRNLYGEKLFFVVHTLGSHFVFQSRYPRAFAVYTDEGSTVSERERWLNAYDNSIIYTDHLLAEMFEALQAYGGAAALLYCSDHGENLKDDHRSLVGHFHNNEYDLPVPMLLWYSDRYQQLRPEFVAMAHENQARPLTTRSVFYTLADLAGIDLADPMLAELSVGSQELRDLPRVVFGAPEPVNYDQWRARSKAVLAPAAMPYGGGHLRGPPRNQQ